MITRIAQGVCFMIAGFCIAKDEWVLYELSCAAATVFAACEGYIEDHE